MSDLRELVAAVQSVVGHVGAVSFTALAFALCFQFVKLAATARAWQGILRASYPGVGVTYPATFGAYLTAVGLNAVVPARGGEVVRVALTKRIIPGSTYAAIAATILVESLMEAALLVPVLVAALSLGLVAGVAIPLSGGWSVIAAHPVLVAGAAVAVLALATILLRVGLRRRIWLQRLAHEARRGFSVFGVCRQSLLRIVAWQAFALACRIAAVWWFLQAFHLHSTPKIVFAVLAVQALASLVPLLPGGAGAQQAMLLVALGGVVPASALLGFSVGTQATVAAFDVVLGLLAVALLLRTLNIRRSLRLLRAQRTAPPATAPPAIAPPVSDA